MAGITSIETKIAGIISARASYLSLGLLVLGTAVIVFFSGCSTDSTTTVAPGYDRNISTLYGNGGKVKLDSAGNSIASDIQWKDSSGALKSLKDLKGSIVLMN